MSIQMNLFFHLKKFVHWVFGLLGLRILKANTYELLLMNYKSRATEKLALISTFSKATNSKLLDLLPSSRSQLNQDLFVIAMLDFKKQGFFVEFGATDGITLSNTYLLETQFNWSGLLVEPALNWHEALKRNRPDSMLDMRCVWSHSGEEITFMEASDKELSTIYSFSKSDKHQRRNIRQYKVETISLNDLFMAYEAPSHIDFLSIDTEGSEFEILNSLDFDKYTFSIIVCEHNFTSKREDIYHLLTSNGYVRTLKNISDFDDWYISKNLSGQIRIT